MHVTKPVQFWDQIRKGLIATLEKFTDDDMNFVAFDRGHSIRQIVLHIAQEEYGEVQYGITRKVDAFPPPFPEESYLTIKSLKALFAKVHQETGRYLEGLAGEDFEKEIEAGWGGKYPLIDMIWHVMEHEIHHRGELSFILGLLGRKGLDA